MTPTDSPSGDAPSQKPTPPDGDRPETYNHRRDRAELEQILALAHRRLDARMNVADLAARRAAVAERLERERREELEQPLDADEPDGTAAQILRSRRAHPSNVRPYDQETET